MHLSGRYPHWWQGRRFKAPIRAWAACVTAESTRDNPQRALLGRLVQGRLQGGALKAALVHTFTRSGLASGGLDQVIIRYRTGGYSQLGFKSYAQGREKWQGPSLDLVWFDEEPPWDIYVEGLTRTNATNGFVMMTFTPLKGYSQVVGHFLEKTAAQRHVTRIKLWDASHLSDTQKQVIYASYAEHERGARANGEPAVGEGRIFPFTEEAIKVDPFEIPAHWARIAALDFGWDHPTAAVLLVHNRDSDELFITRTYRVSRKTPAEHVAVLRTWDKGERGTLSWAWPHDGLQTEKGTGRALASQYREHGLNVLPAPITFANGSNSVEAGLVELYARMQSGTLKVFASCPDWFEEFRLYHRKEGRVVKVQDDLMAATRYAFMGLRFAKPPQQARKRIAQSTYGDYSPFNWG